MRLNPLFAAGIVLVLMAIGISLIPIAGEFMGEGDEWDPDNDDVNETSYNMLVTLEDADGNPVTVQPLRLFSFYYQSTKVTQITVTASWESSGANINWATFQLDGVLTVYCERWRGEDLIRTEEASQIFDSNEATGEFSKTWQLADLLIESTDAQTLDIRLSMDASVQDSYGTLLTDSTADFVTVPFSYSADPGTFSLTGSIGSLPFSAFGGAVVVSPVLVYVLFFAGIALIVVSVILLQKR